MSTDARTVYLTLPDLEAARALARTLLERRLIACANAVPGAVSLYRWEGEVHEDREVVMFCKTTAARLPEVLRVVEEEHPYDVPCAVALTLTEGSEPYLAWIAAEVGEAGSS